VKKYAMGMSKTTDGATLNLAGQLRLRKRWVCARGKTGSLSQGMDKGPRASEHAHGGKLFVLPMVLSIRISPVGIFTESKSGQLRFSLQKNVRTIETPYALWSYLDAPTFIDCRWDRVADFCCAGC
jgi:hypothetical protein